MTTYEIVNLAGPDERTAAASALEDARAPKPGRFGAATSAVAAAFAIAAAVLWYQTRGRLTIASMLLVASSVVQAARLNLPFVLRRRSASNGVPERVRIGPGGIALVRRARTQSIAWRQVRSVREYEAFFLFDIARTPVVAFKAGLPDRGEGLWAELRGALEAKRYLVRSSTGGATITNTAAR